MASEKVTEDEDERGEEDDDDDDDEEEDDEEEEDNRLLDPCADLLRISESKIVFLWEVTDGLLGQTLRLHGFAQTPTLGEAEEVQLVLVEHQHHRLLVDVSLIPPDYAFLPGSLYRFIGELTKATVSGTERRVLRARIATCVDGLDCHVYQRAVALFRERVLLPTTTAYPD